MKKILHLSADDKFVDMALYYFELLSPNKNELVVYANNRLKYVKTPSKIVNRFKSIDKVIKMQDYNLVVIHGLIDVWYKFIMTVPKHIPIVWIGWGFDYYSDVNFSLHLKETEKLLQSNKKSIKSTIRSLYSRIFLPKKSSVINRIDYFAPVLDSEYKIILNAYKNISVPKFIDFNYGSLEKNFIRNYENLKINGDNILIGNSATYTNNHIESFKIIKKIDKFKHSKIICPLSYGDSQYKQKICELGQELFQENFTPLMTFLPIDDYINNITSCRIVIMNHVRQQAFGNIITMLYLGANIFLREENPIYIFLKKSGATIFSIQDLEKNIIPNIFDPLSQQEILKNREILRKNFSEKNTLQKTQNIISLKAQEKYEY